MAPAFQRIGQAFGIEARKQLHRGAGRYRTEKDGGEAEDMRDGDDGDDRDRCWLVPRIMTEMAATEARLRWVSITALGSPVVPEV